MATTAAHLELLAALGALGIATSPQLQAATRRSQPTLSRLLRELSAEVLTLGRGKQTRYALPKPILGAQATQPLTWVHEDGRAEAWGQLAFLAGDVVHVQAPGIDAISRGALPWFLAPLRAQGFLGRLVARHLAARGLDGNPDRWTVEQVLAAAMTLHDAPGAVVLGEPVPSTASASPLQPEGLDRHADAVADTLPAGSSAGGEPAKFLARDGAGRHLIVKFSPPLGTPYGDRWRDLLRAESLALSVLADWGVPVARCEVVETGRRAYLLSERFDRVGAAGRHHVVPLDAVHDAYVAGGRLHWGATCRELERQRRLPPGSGAQAESLLYFGRLIGNTDMHFGNLGLAVAPGDAARGRFTLAPVYDMLPMRWKPDAAIGLPDYAGFAPDDLAAASPAAAPAREFWSRVAAAQGLAPALRRVATEMADRLGPAPASPPAPASAAPARRGA